MLILSIAIMSCGSKAQNNQGGGSIAEVVSTTLRDHYVDKSIAESISESLLVKDKQGKYDSLEGMQLLGEINRDIHLVHNDLHIQLVSVGNNVRLPWSDSFIRSVKIIEGNIGYLKMTHFPEPGEEVYRKLSAAFNLLSGTDGIIIDLRNNRGGHPEVVSEILGYFLVGEVLYDQFYVPAEKKTYKYNSHKKVKGVKLLDKPLHVIVNEKTASSAEILAFAIQNLKLGKVYGTKTMGLVNLAEYYPVNDTIYLLASKGRQQNPFNTEGIEGKGVNPDINIAGEGSLIEAHLDLIQFAHGAKFKDWVSAQLGNHEVFDQHSEEFVRKYEHVTIIKNEGRLIYEDYSGIKYKLEPIGNSTYRLKDQIDDRFRLEFKLEDGDMILVKKYFDGSLVKLKMQGY